MAKSTEHKVTSSIVTFAASTVLIAAQLCGLRSIDIDAEAFRISEDRSMAILEHYSKQVPSAKQAMSVLKALTNRIAEASIQGMSFLCVRPFQVQGFRYT